MTDPYIAKLLEMQNRILDRQAKALEDIAEVLKTGNINVDARWTFWQPTGQECYYIEFAPGTPEEIVKKAMDGMTKAFRAALPVSPRKAAIVITPKCA